MRNNTVYIDESLTGFSTYPMLKNDNKPARNRLIETTSYSTRLSEVLALKIGKTRPRFWNDGSGGWGGTRAEMTNRSNFVVFFFLLF